ncbi:MAG: hypothetical protein J7507_13275 [Pseudoxanthomonas sp.]|nr:hypothetical protein [Pseudoxanthomonas sp.]
MPDRSPRPPGYPAPRDWHEAFAVLPMETPSRGHWPRVASELAHRRLRRRPPAWAIAAAVACIAAAPTLIVLRSAPTTPAQASVDVEVGMPAAQVAVDAPARTAQAAAISGSPGSPDIQQSAAVTPVPAANAGADIELERLYARSARLEAALASLPPSATNAGVEVISQQLVQALGAVDATLADATLDPRGRLALWRERNQLLQQMLNLQVRQASTPFDFAQVN